jgi:diguanylate cyclase (GGDEF)-like protein
MLGRRATDVVGSDFRELLVPEDARGLPAVLDNAERHDGTSDAVDWRMPTAGGHTLHVEAIVSARLNDPAIGGFLVNIRDQTERMALEEALRHQALHDPLTHLPNRVLFEDRLKHAYDRTARSGRSLCLLIADLDDFKDINDTFGHASGDEVLIEVAERFKRATRSEDTVARLGGDEFAVLIEEVASEGDAADVAERLIAALVAPIPIAGTDIYARASIGIVTGSSAGVSGAKAESVTGQLMVDADLAMYEAKREGRSQFQFYAPEMQQGIRERMMMRSDLERALTRQEFALHYQPIVSIDTGTIVGAEALIRWHHPERGLVPPLEFIPLAEKTGIIIDIGRWVLRQACREAAGWQTQGNGSPAPYISVNVAGSQLQQPSFVHSVREALDQAGLDPTRLVIEVTESALIEDTEGNEMKLEQLREMGVRLAIDDFGTGYSSLSYLQRFNLDILKIDKSFVDTLGHDDSRTPALVTAMVAMGTSLSMDVLAEGIESRDQLDGLRALRCDFGQGYLFSRPVPAEDLTALLQAPADLEKIADTSDLEASGRS